MDNNIGEKIKSIAKFFLIFTIIGLCTVFVFLGFLPVPNVLKEIFDPSSIFIIAMLLFFISVFIVLIIYIFICSWGEMVNNVQQIKERLCDIPKQNNEQQEKELKENDNKNAVVYEIKEKPIEKWTCPNCGEQNVERAQNCINCFTKKP